VCVGGYLRKKLSNWLLGYFAGLVLLDTSFSVLFVVKFEANYKWSQSLRSQVFKRSLPANAIDVLEYVEIQVASVRYLIFFL